MNNRKSKEVPVIKNRDYIMDIDNLGSNGEGIGNRRITMFVTQGSSEKSKSKSGQGREKIWLWKADRHIEAFRPAG